MSNEYRQALVGGGQKSGSSCAFKSLGGYNSGSSGAASFGAPVPSSAVQIVPVFGSAGYDALTKPGPSHNGYASINGAYGDCSSQKYVTRMCG